jgi:arginine exporter protein ArgO
MKKVQWVFLLFAFMAAACMAGIGIAISYRSILAILVLLVLLMFVMGYGFKTKKKMRENGTLR